MSLYIVECESSVRTYVVKKKLTITTTKTPHGYLEKYIYSYYITTQRLNKPLLPPPPPPPPAAEEEGAVGGEPNVIRAERSFKYAV